MHRSTPTLFALLIACAAAPAPAAPPTLAYAPNFDAAPGGDFDCATAVGSPAAELSFSAAGCGGNGCSAAIQVASAGDGVPSDLKDVSCPTLITLSGDGVIAKSSDFPGDLQFNGGQASTGSLPLTCQPGSATTRARLCCTQVGLSGTTPSKIYPFFDVDCPSLGAAEFEASPAPGSLALNTEVNQSVQQLVRVRNAGSGVLTVAASGLGGALAVSPANAPGLPGGAIQDFTVSCLSASAGQYAATLRLSSNDADGDEASVTYPVTCQVRAPAPVLAITPAAQSTLSLAAVQPVPASAGIIIANPGDAALVISAVDGASGPFALEPGTATIAPGAQQAFSLACDASNRGEFSTTLVFHSNAPGRETVIEYATCSVTGADIETTPAAPSLLDLVATQGSGEVSRVVSLRNLGSAGLTVRPSLGAGSAGAFQIDGTPVTIAPGGSAPLALRCSRATVGNFSGSLHLDSNDSDEGSLDFSLRCTVNAGAAAEFSSQPAAPGTVQLTATAGASAEAAIVVSNIGNAPLQLLGVQEGSAGGVLTAVAGAVPQSIAPGGSWTLPIRCDATGASPGNYTDSVVIRSDDADEAVVTFNLACTVLASVPSAEFDASPAGGSTIAIATHLAGKTGIVVRNLGNANLDVGAATLSTPFAIEPAGATLAPGATQTLTISCSSRTFGHYTATLTLTTNDPDDGEGTVTFPLVCDVTPAPPEFASIPEPEELVTVLSAPVAIGSFASTTIELFDTMPLGSQLMTVTPVPPSPPLYLDRSGTITVVPGQTAGVPLGVTCIPTQEGASTQTLVLDTNATNVDPARYVIACIGTPGPRIDSVPAPGTAAISLATVDGKRVSTLVRLINRGGAPLVISALQGLSAPLSTSVKNGLPQSIAAGSAIDLQVICDSATEGTFGGTLEVVSNDRQRPAARYGISCRVDSQYVLFRNGLE